MMIKKTFIKIFAIILTACFMAGMLSACNNKTVKKGVWYEAYIMSFADSDNDRLGDLKGFTDKLDYLSELGVSGVWLMPIFSAMSLHKYDALNYMEIDKQYGTLEDFDNMIKEANKREIAIILDLVVNCVSSSHEWFKSASSDKNSPYRDYFYFYEDYPEGTYSLDEPWKIDGNSTGLPAWHEVKGNPNSHYLGLYADSMPDLNFNSKALREEIKKVAKYWLERGVAGFRLDSAMHLYSNAEITGNDSFQDKNIEWWTEFFDYCKTINKDCYLVGEVWSNDEVRASYMTALGSDFNFSAAGNFLGELSSEGSTNNSLAKKTQAFYELCEKKTAGNYIDAPFLTNHDMSRVSKYLNNDMAKMKLAASFYLTLKGMPFIYYGEEVGMLQAEPTSFPVDKEYRRAFPWGDNYDCKLYKYELDSPTYAEQKDDNSSIYNHYKSLITVRNASSALTSGDFTAYALGEGIVSYTREFEGESVLVAHNFSTEDVTFTVDTQFSKALFGNLAAKDGNTVTIKPYGTIILGNK